MRECWPYIKNEVDIRFWCPYSVIPLTIPHMMKEIEIIKNSKRSLWGMLCWTIEETPLPVPERRKNDIRS